MQTLSIDAKKAPELYALFLEVDACNCSEWSDVKIRLRAKHIFFPDWATPFLFDNTVNNRCLRFNHTAGKGCTRGDCSKTHECIVCKSDNHGAFFLREGGPDSLPVCRTQRAWIRQLAFYNIATLDDFVTGCCCDQFIFTNTPHSL